MQYSLSADREEQVRRSQTGRTFPDTSTTPSLCLIEDPAGSWSIPALMSNTEGGLTPASLTHLGVEVSFPGGGLVKPSNKMRFPQECVKMKSKGPLR